MNRWVKYLIAAFAWTVILAGIEWIGVTAGFWKYRVEIEALGIWSFLVYYPLVLIAGYVLSVIIDVEITRESHWFHDGLITFSLGSVLAMAMQVGRLFDILGYQSGWNAACCWILQTAQIVLLRALLGKLYFWKLKGSEAAK